MYISLFVQMTWEEIALKCPRVKKAKINFFLSNYIVSNSSPYWEKPINWEPNLDDLGEVLDPGKRVYCTRECMTTRIHICIVVCATIDCLTLNAF